MKQKLIRFLLSIGISLLLLFALLVYFSPQKTPQFLDKEGAVIENSIAEIIDVEINGVSQRLLIRGKNLYNPLLLHLHGGPGGPDRPLMNTKDNLEDLFTVCYWDQRGAGASYSKKILPETMNQDQIIKDGLKVSKYLLNRFEKEKLYLEAHSWGTLFGIQMAHREPELFHAYFGIGQGVNSLKSEQLSYDFVYKSAKEANDNKTINELEKIGRPPYLTDEEWVTNILKERELLKKYETLTSKEKLSTFSIYKGFILYPEYSINDKLKSLNGHHFSLVNLWPEAKKTNLFKTVTKFEVPIYIFQGKHDMSTVTVVAKEYFDTLEAPQKKYYSFEKSAHWPHITEFKKYKSIIHTIVNDEN